MCAVRRRAFSLGRVLLVSLVIAVDMVSLVSIVVLVVCGRGGMHWHGVVCGGLLCVAVGGGSVWWLVDECGQSSS